METKTAEDFLCDVETAFVNEPRTLFEWNSVIDVMRDYAKQQCIKVRQECANNAAKYLITGTSSVEAVESILSTTIKLT